MLNGYLSFVIDFGLERDLTMKLLRIILTFGFLFVSFTFAQTENPTIKAEKVYKQSGAKIFSPNETNWQIVKNESSETIFGKTTIEEKFNVFVRTKTISDFENIEDLFENIEKMKQSELNIENRDSLHYNRTNFKETPCLQYDGVFNNDEAVMPGYKHFNFFGYLCRHPKNKNIVVQIEFSNFSISRGFSESALKLSKDFFSKIQFIKIKK